MKKKIVKEKKNHTELECYQNYFNLEMYLSQEPPLSETYISISVSLPYLICFLHKNTMSEKQKSQGFVIFIFRFYSTLQMQQWLLDSIEDWSFVFAHQV